MNFSDIGLGVIAGILIATAAYFLIRAARRKRIGTSLGMSLYLIKLPHAAKEDQPSGEGNDFKTELAHFEQLLGGLVAIKAPFVFEVAVPHVGEEIHFYLSVPKLAGEVAVRQIQSLWTGASVEFVPDDFTVFNAHGASVAAYVKQGENFALPLKTYVELGIDSFEPIAGSLAKLHEIGEGAAIQVVAQPAGKGSKKAIQKYIDLLKRGNSPDTVFKGGFSFSPKDLKQTFYPDGKDGDAKEKPEKIIDDEAIKALQSKIAKPLFFVNVRLVASAGSQFQANDVLEGLAAGFSQFASPLRNDLRVVTPRNPKSLIREFIYREFSPSQAMILSTEEIASFYHLPITTTATPHVKWLKSREAPPPENLPKQGLLIGESAFRGEKKPIYITDEDRRRHFYIIGQTGTGKTTLIKNMVIEDIRAGKGFAIIDPHGDLTEGALAFVPKERLDDVIYFNPGDLTRPMGLNMLEYNFDRPEEKTFIINELLSIFDRLYDLKATGGPMFELYMRNALALLMEDMPNEPATLMEVPRIFSDPEFRKRKLARIHNPTVIDFWEKEVTKTSGDQSLANMAVYVGSKFTPFIGNDYMRPIIGQPKSSFNFREVMDSGKILLINLSKGRIGDINANLLGMIFTGKILMAALSRVDIAEEQRRDFNLYIDEFQNFTTDSISTIFSEARKYHLNLTVAHQFIAQLDDKIRDSVFGNVGSMAVMRVGATDAEFLAKQFAPTFSENDLANIDNFNAYVKLLINGQPSKPFNMKVGTAAWSGGDKALGDKLKEYSRTKYGEDRAVIETEIRRRLRE